ncbi:hypothetical protein [Calothrix rhizosoleniae]|nr:hypothetical protein [Calothrix rhizosoleniae]
MFQLISVVGAGKPPHLLIQVIPILQNKATHGQQGAGGEISVARI